MQLRGPDGKTSTGIIQIVGDDKERPRIVARWSGCFETVYVPDPTTGLVRKLQRNEDKDTTKDGRPGTGSYAPWVEAWCEAPGAPGFGHGFDWPKLITEKEVRHLLGNSVYEHFDTNKKAVVSKTYNLTGYPFSIIGHRGTLKREQWLTLPAVTVNVQQKLIRTSVDTGRIIGDPNARPPKTQIYTYSKRPNPIRDCVPAKSLKLEPPRKAPEPDAIRRAPRKGAGGGKIGRRTLPALVAVNQSERLSRHA